MTKSSTLEKVWWKIVGNVRPWFALNLILLAALLAFDASSLEKPSWWEECHSLAMNLLTGGLVSFFFYWLVVYVPEQRKRKVIKRNLLKMYERVKRDILLEVIFASKKGGRHDLSADSETIQKLMTVEGFKDTFQDGREGDEGFYAFQNQMSDDTPEFHEIIGSLEVLAKQIEFVLHNYTMNDEGLFDFFKRLEVMLISLGRSTPGYDESKPLCGFIYQMFSGWSPLEGYLGYDPIDRMISDI